MEKERDTEEESARGGCVGMLYSGVVNILSSLWLLQLYWTELKIGQNSHVSAELIFPRSVLLPAAEWI